MEPCSRVRVAKCQMLATSLFVLLLGSAMAATAALSYFGPHFTVIGPVSADRTTYEALHHWAFSAGIALAALLTLGAMLSAAATVRGAGGLMAAAFLSFALVFCALVQAAFWRAHSPTQMEDAVLDAYDRAYERALRSASGSGRQELVAIQDTGPRPPSPGTQSLQMHPGGIPVSTPVQSRCSWGPSESKQTLGSASAAPGHPPAYPRERRSYGLDSHVTLVGGEELFPSTWWGVREEEA